MKNLLSARKGFTLVEIMIVVAIIGIVVAIAVPGFMRARSQSRMKSCQENLTKIDHAKDQWALENRMRPGTSPDSTHLSRSDRTGYLNSWPHCPSGPDYVINAIGSDPECNTGYPGHSLSEIGDAITEME